MKVKIIVEETINQEFEVEVTDMDNAFDQIRTMYKNGDIVVDNPELTDAQLAILDEDGQIADWNNLM